MPTSRWHSTTSTVDETGVLAIAHILTFPAFSPEYYGGEDGLLLGRACILDDGNYHYALSTLAEENSAGALRQTLSDMYESCNLLDPEINLRTGS